MKTSADELNGHIETLGDRLRAVEAERDRYREAIQKAMRHLGKVPCDAPGLDLCPACEAQITLRDALEYRDAA